jgi:hypothetical protein
MSKELAASVLQSFSRSLSAEEKAIAECISSPKLHSLSEQEFRELIAQAAVINSIKALPSDIEVTLLQQLTQNTYRSTSIKDWQNAFLYNAIGKDFERVEAFNLFSISFMADVLKRYEDYKAKVWRELNKALILPEAEPKHVEATDPINVLHADAERWKAGKETWVEISAPFNCQRLFRKGIYKKSMWAAEVWERFEDIAKQKVEAKFKASNKVILGESAQSEFDALQKIELSRIVYIDIIKQINKEKS